jgi:hypothetical protein
MTDKVEFKKLRGFGEIINDTFVFIRQNIKPLLKVFVYFCGFFVLASGVASVLQQLGMRNAMLQISEQGPGDPFSFFNKIFTINYLLVILFSMANYAAMYVSILSFITLYIEKGKVVPGVDEVWAYFKYYFLRVFGSSLLVTLFFLVCFIACIVPGIYVFPAMSLFFPVMIFENGSWGYTFGRSFKLLKDEWWVTAATIFIVYIITMACMSFISVPIAIMGMASAFTQGTKVMSDHDHCEHDYPVCRQIFMVIPIIALSLCYFNLVERKENLGLMSRIDDFGQAKSTFGAPEQY